MEKNLLLSDFLEEEKCDQNLKNLILELSAACLEIKKKILEGQTGTAGTKNSYGEEQKALDLQADEILIKTCENSEVVAAIASEEIDSEIKTGRGEFAVCFDPLDGSSLIDVNLSVGSIVSIYKAKTFSNSLGRDLVTAFFVVYGPRTTMMLSIGKGSFEFQADEKGNWLLKTENIKVEKEGKMFAPGNLAQSATDKSYKNLLNYWLENDYKLRYSGGMVPDVNQILLKGKGIFMYPGSEKNPNGKLRLLFECRPMAFLLEQAGGSCTNGKAAILDLPLKYLEDCSPIFLGSTVEVEIAQKFFNVSLT